MQKMAKKLASRRFFRFEVGKWAFWGRFSSSLERVNTDYTDKTDVRLGLRCALRFSVSHGLHGFTQIFVPSERRLRRS
jgi:hypothetical protein